MHARNKTEKQRGWTYIEVSIVMAVLISLAGIGLPMIMSSTETARCNKAIVEITWLSTTIREFQKKNLELPRSLNELDLGDQADPWGTPYQYLDFSTVKGKGKLRKNKSLVPLNTDLDLYSMGPDRQSKAPLTAKASKDDIIRANDGDFIGRAEDY